MARVAEPKVRHWTTEEVAARYRVSVRTVEGWRADDWGPRWLPGRGNRGVLYREADLDAWDESRVHTPGAA